MSTAGQPALLEHVRAHDEIRVPEEARGSAVRADAAGESGQVEDDLGIGVAEEARGVVLMREVVVGAARDDDLVAAGLEPLDEVGAEKARAAGDERSHSTGAGAGAGAPQSTRPAHLARLSEYHAIVCRTPSSHETSGCQPVSRASFSKPTFKREYLAGARAMALGDAHDLAVARPVAGLLAHAEDEVGPVAHGDVLALAVDVDVARHAVGGDREVAPDTVRAVAEVAKWLELAELDALPLERLRDDRPRDEARVLPRPVVVEHPRDDARDAERVVVVHRQEVRRHLRRRVHGLRVERRALVEDDAAVCVELMLVDDRVARVAVLLRRPRGVEALQLEVVVEDRLEEVERAYDVRHHRLVRPVPGLADVRLGPEMEDVRPVGRLLQLAHEVVDRSAVGEVGELDHHPLAQVADVVQRAARRRADESDDVRAQLDECLREV